MKYTIDFSIFSSPTEAYGNATGEIELRLPPRIGQTVDLVCGVQLKITSFAENVDGWTGVGIGLEDMVFNSREEARDFALRLESELNFFVVTYHDE